MDKRGYVVVREEDREDGKKGLMCCRTGLPVEMLSGDIIIPLCYVADGYVRIYNVTLDKYQEVFKTTTVIPLDAELKVARR